MKTRRFYSAMMFLMALLFAVALQATTTNVTINPPVVEHEYTMIDENYIDDIPFNTAEITSNHNYVSALSAEFTFDEETYVDDIPFDTEKESIQKEFNFSDEAYINDIPFDTYAVVKGHNCNSQYALK